MSINHQGLSINLSRFDAWLKPAQQLFAQVPLNVWRNLVRLLLVFWLAYGLAQVFWILFPSPTIPAASLNPDSFAVDKTSGAKASVDITRLKTLTPFGNPAATAPVPEVAIDTTQAADTQLNLILKGLFYSSDEKMARAVIAASDRQEVFSVGDTIPVGNSVTLAKILPDRVIISNNGKPETLWLFKDDPNAPRMSANYAARQPMNRSIDEYNNQPPPVYYQETEQPVASAPATPINSPEDQARISRMNTSLADVVSMSIHREGGQIVGYKIRPGRNAEMFNSLGLQTDDVVTAVNGMPLDNPGKIMEIYRNLGSATSANLEIMRNGSRMNLDISLN